MQPDGLLFSILPVTAMVSATDSRKERSWRISMLQKHRLLGVVKLPEDLFGKNVSKGTYGVLIRAHKPHNLAKDKVFWGIMDDGMQRTKTGRDSRGNIAEIEKAMRVFVSTNDEPEFIPRQMDCTVIRTDSNEIFDLSPEKHIDRDTNEGVFDLSFLSHQMQIARLRLSQPSGTATAEPSCRPFPLHEFIVDVGKGKSGRKKNLPQGTLPLISTSETENGISALVDSDSVNQVYESGGITVSSNGGSGCAFYHNYKFAANDDVWVLTLKAPYDSPAFSVFLCAAINNESWRYNYYRKFNKAQLESSKVQIPVDQNDDIDFERIERLARKAGL